jgi:threonine synthase
MENKHIVGKHCIVCNAKYKMDEVELTCPKCGIEGILDIDYDYDYIKTIYKDFALKSERKDIFKFAPLLPLKINGPKPRTLIGPTPLIESLRLKNHLGLGNLDIKDDGRLPTASYKDRASAMAVARAKELNISQIVAASTGNAAASIAGLTAPEGITSIIFVPHTAPKAKIAQLLTFGAKVFTVEGTYDDAFELSIKAAELGFYSRSTAVNPILSEGKKTGILELMDQLNYKNIPDYIAVSVGDGCIIGGLAKGLRDLYEMGFINKLPRLIGVQSTGSKVIYEAWKNNEQLNIITPTTKADSISVAFPRDYLKAVRGVKYTDGLMVTVEDDEIFEASYLLGKYEGVFAEPAGSTPLAGIISLAKQDIIKPSDRITIFVTGSGLKDVAGASRNAPNAQLVPTGDAGLEAVKKAIGK